MASPPIPRCRALGFDGRAGDLPSYFVDPWFDGANYRATIIVSPHRGTLIPAGQVPDLTDDPVVRIVVRELELCAYVGPASLLDCSLTSRDRSAPDGASEVPRQRKEEVFRRTLEVEEAPRLELLPEHYRFGKVRLDDRQNLNNRRFAEQIGRQLWPFLEPAGVQSCPADFVARHLIVAPCASLCGTAGGWLSPAHLQGRPRQIRLEQPLREVAGVAREVRLFQDEVRALLTGDLGTDTDAMQSQSHVLLQRVIDLQLAAAMPENGILRRFYDATRFDGVLGMLRELSTAVVRHTEAKRAELQTRLLTILGAMFSLLSAWSAVAALANVKLEDFSFQSWSDWRQHPALIVALALVSLGVLITLGIALMAPAKAGFERRWQPRTDASREDSSR